MLVPSFDGGFLVWHHKTSEPQEFAAVKRREFVGAMFVTHSDLGSIAIPARFFCDSGHPDNPVIRLDTYDEMAAIYRPDSAFPPMTAWEKLKSTGWRPGKVSAVR